ncbi:YfbK domain-containing protein [Crateriforma conspicua]|uniref:von Willebrand factor n=1 Tax=Crateriforma conspicua TaxID=2527996 RepID=A0A5C5XY32_9PLAN|nr:von Willebrand factor type A domain-containing protein [Crateriforma conspicua]TWT68277.1 von Willebrand factor [Crateriforma conspicua]
MSEHTPNQPDFESSGPQAWDDPRVTAYVLGEMSDEDNQAFETEMTGNESLSAAVEEAKAVTGGLEHFYAELSDATDGLDAERRDAIRREAAVAPATDSTTNDTGGPGFWRQHGVTLAVAASLLLVVGGLVAYPSVQSARRQVAMTDAETAGEFAADEYAEAEMRFDDMAVDEEGLYEIQESGDVTIAAVPELGMIVQQDESSRLSTVAPADRKSDSLRRSNRPSKQLTEFAQNESPQSGSAVDHPFGDVDSKVTQKLKLDADSYGDNADFAVPDRVARGITPMQRGQETSGSAPTSESKTRVLGREPSAGKPVASQPAAGQPVADTPVAGGAYGGARIAGDKVRFRSEDGTNLSLGVTPRIMIEAEEEPAQLGFGMDTPEGTGPGFSGDRFEPITDNPFKRVDEHPLSTFSIDVDTASYSKIRSYLDSGRLPRPDAVRIEEMLNYFDYAYAAPRDDAPHPFAHRVAVMDCPWNEKHMLARIAIKGKEMKPEQRPRCNLVFLLDTSGSMNRPNKLPLVQEGMKMLIKELNDDDRVAIVTYAGSAGLVLESTPASKKRKIRRSLTQLSAGGSTNGGQGIALAYQTAREHFIKDGVNRVILCTDGDFNVGTTGTDALVSMVEQESKGGIFLTVMGFGMGNHNDSMMEQISGRGNGNYAFIDTEKEARKVLVNQTSSTLVTIAKDVKIQVEFNPSAVSSYRLIGYENRVLAKEDFNDDKKDAGEIGAGHAVTALYELVPAGVEADALPPKVDPLKYQANVQPKEDAESTGELMTLKLRYKQPDGDTSTLVETPVKSDIKTSFAQADDDARFAAAVAGFGMQLRRSEYKGSWTMPDVIATAKDAKGEDVSGFRSEMIKLATKAGDLMGE